MPESLFRMWEVAAQSVGHLSTGELILRIALIGCSLFATVQLLSLLATHYGDSNAVSKSFFLSLLLHFCLGLGWATAVNMPRSAVSSEDPQPQAVRVSLVDGDDTSTETGDSTRTTWSSTPPLDAERTRLERTDEAMTAVEPPRIEKAQTPAPDVPTAADLPARPESPVPVPMPESVASPPTASPFQSTTDIDQEAPQARPELQTQVAATRQQTSREVSRLDGSPRVELQRGAAERMSTFVEDGVVLTLPNELSPDAAAPRPVGAPDTIIRRRSSPSPTPADVAETGSSPASTSAIATGNRRTEKFVRAGSRRGTDADFEDAQPAKTRSIVPQDQIASRASIGNATPDVTPRPELARPGTLTLNPRAPTRDPEPYRSRRIEQRRAIALKNGGSEESERAVEASLRWMAGIQEPAGNWSAARHGGGTAKVDPQGNNRLDGGTYADSGITGLVVLSFLGAGYTHDEGKYSDVILRAIRWLIEQQHSNGYLGGKATRYDMMYCHAMATFALAEAYGMQNDPNAHPELRDAVRRGVHLICDMQNADGGWRYGKGSDSDMSMFGWQLMALKSAVHAGIPVPEETRRGMTTFLHARAVGTRGGLAGYKATDRPSPAMTAEALFCRQMFGVRPNDGASQEAVAYLRLNLPHISQYDEYYWYYGTLAMFQYDGEPWQVWNGALRDMLVGLQRTQGPLAGSWDPNGKWAGIGGRLYSTAVSTMCLEVYYRFLRIYQSE